MYEQEPNPTYTAFSKSSSFSAMARRSPSEAPISPIHFVTEEALRLPNCFCPPRTYRILVIARTMTKDFLDLHDGWDADQGLFLTSGEHSTMLDCQAAVQLYQELLRAPSATAADSPMVNDAVYEACRIAAIIHCTALLFHIELSAAYAHPHVLANTPQPLVSLGAALMTSDAYNFWGERLFGPLLWVVLVGSVAAAPAIASMEEREQYLARKQCRWILNRCKLKSWVDGTMDSTFDAVRTMLRVQNFLRA